MGPEESDEGEPDGFALTTARLALRRPVMADAPAIAALANDRGLAENLSRLPYPYGRADALDFIEKVRDFRAPDVALVITRRAGGEVMGACGLEKMREDGDHVIGCWLGRPFWGFGYATEAAHALVDHAFAGAGLDRIAVNCRVTNAASRRVIHKCGFQPTGADMIHSLAVGGAVPVECYELDRSTWRALRRWREEGHHAAC